MRARDRANIADGIFSQKKGRDVIWESRLQEIDEFRSFDGNEIRNRFGRAEHVEAAEKEHLVRLNWAAQRESELVSPRDRNDATGRLVRHVLKDVARREFVIPVVFEEGAMKLVAARFGDRVDNDRAAPSVFRRVIVQGHAEFRDRIGVESYINSAGVRVAVGRDAVHIVAVAVAPLAVRVHFRLADQTKDVEAAGPACEVAYPGHAGSQRHEVQDVSPGHRQVTDLRRRNIRGDLAFGTLQRRWFGSHGDRLGDVANFQRERYCSRLGGAKSDVLLRHGSETLGRDRDLVLARRQSGKTVRACGIGLRRLADAGLSVDKRYLSFRDYSSAGISYRAFNGAPELGMRRAGKSRNEQYTSGGLRKTFQCHGCPPSVYGYFKDSIRSSNSIGFAVSKQRSYAF